MAIVGNEVTKAFIHIQPQKNLVISGWWSALTANAVTLRRIFISRLAVAESSLSLLRYGQSLAVESA